MNFKKVRKKPIEVEAFQLTEEFIHSFWKDENDEFKSGFGHIDNSFHQKANIAGHEINVHSYFLIIPTLEGKHKAKIGDWIIKGVKGELYPCKPDIFEQTYEVL